MAEIKIPKQNEKIDRGLGFYHGILTKVSRLN
jgi:hypothetical protein